MALQSSGAISLSDLQTEFGGSNPISLSEYYRGGAYVPDTPTNSGVPTSGAISLSDFYGAADSLPALTSGTVGLYTYNASWINTAATTWQTVVTKTFVYTTNSTLQYRVRATGYTFYNPGSRSNENVTRSVRWTKNGSSIVSVTSPANAQSSIVSANVATNTNDVLRLQAYTPSTSLGNTNVYGNIRANTNPGGVFA